MRLQVHVLAFIKLSPYAYLTFFLAIVADQEVTEATRAYLATNTSLADLHCQWSIRLGLLKEDHSDYFFRMTYFHHLYQRARSDIIELEVLMEANPIEVD
jgi:hypothetical protein